MAKDSAGDILDKIIAHKRQELAKLGKISQADVKPSSKDLCHFIATQKKEVAIIAEIKRATPFKGKIHAGDLNATAAAKMAQVYEDGGAAAVSVLTDEKFFSGSLADLEAIGQKIALPVIRKDFIIDARQIYQARLYEADAVLLIARCLSDNELKQFLDICHGIHMRALVEVHDEPEIERALATGARVIGINNRNLRDGSVDLKVTERLAKKLPGDIVLVSESGIHTPEDIRRLHGVVDAVLVGTAFMQSADPQKLLEQFVAAGAA